MEDDTERRKQAMDVQDVIAQARDTLTVKRVVGEPYEKDGVTVIPAARVQGGAGWGSGEDPQGQGQGQGQGKGSGSGFSMTARRVGAFIVRDGELSRRPAVDVNRIVLGGQLVAVARPSHRPGDHQSSSQAVSEAGPCRGRTEPFQRNRLVQKRWFCDRSHSPAATSASGVQNPCPKSTSHNRPYPWVRRPFAHRNIRATIAVPPSR
jgi:hypothetical protein